MKLLKHLMVLAVTGILSLCVAPYAIYAETNKQDTIKQDVVILLHGLGRTNRSMKKIQFTLEQQGYLVNNINYPSKKLPIEALVSQYITPVIAQYPTNKTIHFVTHSLGGILVRVYLDKHDIPNLGKVVMLGPPNKGSELVDVLGKYHVYRWYLGPSFLQLSTDERSIPNQLAPPTYRVGIIAGTKSRNPFLSHFIKGENDGKVSLRSATLKGQAIKKIEVSHTWMMKNNMVIQEIIHFLKFNVFTQSNEVK